MESAHAASAHHDLNLVVVSVVVAVLASYTTLTLAIPVTHSRGRARLTWLVGGSMSMGIGIWSMHFIGMLALHLPVPVRHDIVYMLLSLGVAIAAAGLALFIVQRPRVTWLMSIVGALAMGGAISGMHYLGMHGLLVPMHVSYWWPLVIFSIAIAIGASGVALRLARGFRGGGTPWLLRAASALIMGFAISGMHYTAMAAVDFTPAVPYHEYAARLTIDGHDLRWPVILGAFLVLGLTLVGAIAETHFQTARRRATDAESALRASEERFRAIIEATQEWVWEMTAEGITTYSNPASIALLGAQPETLIGEDHFARVYEGDRDKGRACLKHAAASGSPWTNQVLRWRASDGTTRYLESNATPILDAAGTVVGFRGADRDISDRKQSEAMKSDFVSFVSHQLRTPLSGVNWMLELAAETPGLSPDAAAYVSEARESATRLIRLVNDLLDISRLESGRLAITPEVIQMGDVVEEVVAELRPLIDEKHLTLTIARYAAEPAVHVDRQLMRQAITNLLSNAIKYTPDHGSIDVSLSTRQGLVTCSFRDSGIGVPKEACPRLFEKFYRADNAVVVESEGTGLGLHLVRLVVEQFGGRVWCDPACDHGALFIVELPVAHEGRSLSGTLAPLTP
jgi:PAS domain S-box-containing protein